MNVEIVAGVEGELLESPVWDAGARALWLVDILAPAILRYEPASGRVDRWPMPASVGSIAMREGGGLVVALRDRIATFDPSSGRLETLASVPHDASEFRCNDGRSDRQGRFWVGTMHEPKQRAEAALYRLDAASGLHRVVSGITLANGLAFSADGRGAWFADSVARTVWRFDLDPDSGALTGRREFLKFDQGKGAPDGATVDAEGGYWVAAVHAGELLRLDPAGAVERRVALPTPWPTMPAFGGDDLRTMYVTTLRHRANPEGLARFPASGRLLALDAGVAGIAEPRVRI